MPKFSYVLQPRDLRLLQRVTMTLAGLLDGMTPDTAIPAKPKRRYRRRRAKAAAPARRTRRPRTYPAAVIPDAPIAESAS